MSAHRSLREEIHQTRPFASPSEEAFLNLLRTAGMLQGAINRFLKPHGLTSTRYNALRILRGSHPDALTCGEIGERLVSPVPDVTRLVDRLVQVGHASRSRDAGDRRVVRVSITPEGLDLLKRLDEPVNRWLEEQLGHLGATSLNDLSLLLEQARS